MRKVLVAALLTSICVGLVRDIGPKSGLLFDANRLATERIDWRIPINADDDQDIVLDFDDIGTTDGQAAIGHYNGLVFEGLTVVNVSDSSIIDKEDSDCATSYPNTLVSSWYPDDKFPQIKIGAAQSSDGRSPLVFDIVSLSIKPRSERFSDPVIIANKFSQLRNGRSEAIVLDQVFHGVGHHAVTHNDYEKYGFYLHNLTAVEFNVMEDGKVDFAFCLDDLEVRIHTQHD